MWVSDALPVIKAKTASPSQCCKVSHLVTRLIQSPVRASSFNDLTHLTVCLHEKLDPTMLHMTEGMSSGAYVQCCNVMGGSADLPGGLKNLLRKLLSTCLSTIPDVLRGRRSKAFRMT